MNQNKTDLKNKIETHFDNIKKNLENIINSLQPKGIFRSESKVFIFNNEELFINNNNNQSHLLSQYFICICFYLTNYHKYIKDFLTKNYDYNRFEKLVNGSGLLYGIYHISDPKTIIELNDVHHGLGLSDEGIYRVLAPKDRKKINISMKFFVFEIKNCPNFTEDNNAVKINTNHLWVEYDNNFNRQNQYPHWKVVNGICIKSRDGKFQSREEKYVSYCQKNKAKRFGMHKLKFEEPILLDFVKNEIDNNDTITSSYYSDDYDLFSKSMLEKLRNGVTNSLREIAKDKHHFYNFKSFGNFLKWYYPKNEIIGDYFKVKKIYKDYVEIDDQNNKDEDEKRITLTLASAKDRIKMKFNQYYHQEPRFFVIIEYGIRGFTFTKRRKEPEYNISHVLLPLNEGVFANNVAGKIDNYYTQLVKITTEKFKKQLIGYKSFIIFTPPEFSELINLILNDVNRSIDVCVRAGITFRLNTKVKTDIYQFKNEGFGTLSGNGTVLYDDYAKLRLTKKNFQTPKKTQSNNVKYGDNNEQSKVQNGDSYHYHFKTTSQKSGYYMDNNERMMDVDHGILQVKNGDKVVKRFSGEKKFLNNDINLKLLDDWNKCAIKDDVNEMRRLFLENQMSNNGISDYYFINQVDQSGIPAYFWASLKGSKNVLKFLKDKNVDTQFIVDFLNCDVHKFVEKIKNGIIFYRKLEEYLHWIIKKEMEEENERKEMEKNKEMELKKRKKHHLQKIKKRLDEIKGKIELKKIQKVLDEMTMFKKELKEMKRFKKEMEERKIELIKMELEERKRQQIKRELEKREIQEEEEIIYYQNMSKHRYIIKSLNHIKKKKRYVNLRNSCLLLNNLYLGSCGILYTVDFFWYDLGLFSSMFIGYVFVGYQLMMMFALSFLQWIILRFDKKTEKLFNNNSNGLDLNVKEVVYIAVLSLSLIDTLLTIVYTSVTNVCKDDNEVKRIVVSVFKYCKAGEIVLTVLFFLFFSMYCCFSAYVFCRHKIRTFSYQKIQ